MASDAHDYSAVSSAGTLLSGPADLRLEADGSVVFRPGGRTMASIAVAKSPDQILRFTTVIAEQEDEHQPPVFGRYDIDADCVRFTPYFPFEPGVPYRVVFDDRAVWRAQAPGRRTFEFCIPLEADGDIPAVDQLYPTGDCLPENLLRFYIRFTRAMQRGRSGDEISLVGPDGDPVADALYRPPAELWDPGMRCLTVLLDPGRLKRFVGPNRALGPPLSAGRRYSLRIGAGMTDESGRPMGRAFIKHFLVGDALREAVATERWTIITPRKATRDPMSITFPDPMDWISMSRGLAIESGGRMIDGTIRLDQDEKRWRFTPTDAWAEGDHAIAISADVADVCGNSLLSAFDRPIRAVARKSPPSRTINFSPR